MQEIVALSPFIRVIAGGQQTDFPLEKEKEAMEYLRKELLRWTYCSIRKMYIFKKEE
jgi:hypothetical protein